MWQAEREAWPRVQTTPDVIRNVEQRAKVHQTTRIWKQSYFSITSFMQIRPQCHNKLRQSKSQTRLRCSDGYTRFEFSQSPWSFPTALTFLRSCGLTMRDFTVQQRLRYQAGPWALESPTLSCEVGTSPHTTVSCEWWTLTLKVGEHHSPETPKTFSSTCSGSALVQHLTREAMVICQPAEWAKQREVRAQPASSPA